MFNQQFKNTKIVFLGDSILAHGHYMYDMRSFISRSQDKCYVFNRGIGGNRADMAFDLLDEEVFAIKPDYCLISYGVNDLGGWLYDSKAVVDEKNLEERRVRNENFYNGIDHIVKRCKENGVIPILASSYAVNELIAEKDNIETLGDSKEKAEKLGASFYKQETLKNVNDAVRIYREFLIKYAKEHEGVLFFDVFTKTYDALYQQSGLFAEDGVHYSLKGHSVIAKIMLEFLGYENVTTEFIHDEQNDEVRKVEQIERSARFVQYNEHNALMGNFTKQEILDKAKNIIKDESQPKWLKESYVNYLNYVDKLPEIRQQSVDLTIDYIGR